MLPPASCRAPYDDFEGLSLVPLDNAPDRQPGPPPGGALPPLSGPPPRQPHPPGLPVAAVPLRMRVQFHGEGGEFFRIWIVNLLLTVLTLGIYSAWAKVRTRRYFYGCTSLAGSTFEYLAEPVAILKGRAVLAVALLLLYASLSMMPLFGAALLVGALPFVPALIVSSLRFNYRVTRWRNVAFRFTGSYGGAAVAFLLWPLLGVVSFGLLWPKAIQAQRSYLLNHVHYGNAAFSADIPLWPVYGCSIVASVLLGIVTAVATVLSGLMLARAGLRPQSMADLDHWQLFALVLPTLAYLFGLTLSAAYYRAALRNIVLADVAIGDGHGLRSHVSVLDYIAFATGNLLLTVVTLGLARPWVRVRTARYFATTTTIRFAVPAGAAMAGIAAVTEAAGRRGSTLGDAAGDAFDWDLSL